MLIIGIILIALPFISLAGILLQVAFSNTVDPSEIFLSTQSIFLTSINFLFGMGSMLNILLFFLFIPAGLAFIIASGKNQNLKSN